MLTRPPELIDEQLIADLVQHWQLPVDSIDYVALGFGSHHWRVSGADHRLFVTVDDLDMKVRSADDTRDGAFQRLSAALTTARSLADLGMAFVVAPLASIDGDIAVRIDERFALAVYPHVEGRNHAWGEFTSKADRRAVMDMAAMVHTAPEAAATHAGIEDFELANRDALADALNDLDESWTTGPFAEPTRSLLAEHAGGISRTLDRYDLLVADARRHPARMVLTHGEPHIGNTIATPTGWVLVDWDTALIAPPERDMWTVAKGDDSIIADYQAATGTTIEPDVMALYRLAWDLAEIAVYTAQFRRPHIDTTDDRQAFANLALSIQSRLGQTGSTDRI